MVSRASDTPIAAAPAGPRLPDGPAINRNPLMRLRQGVQLYRDPVGVVTARFERYGDTYCVGDGGQRLFVTRDPACIRDILVSSSGAFGKGHSAFKMLARALGNSLLVTDGETWRRQRRLVQPAFARPRLVEYSQVMADCAVGAADQLSASIGREVDMSAAVIDLTLSIVAKTLFGQARRRGDKTVRAMRWLNEGFAQPDILPSYVPTPARALMWLAKRDLDRTVYGLIEHRRRLLKRGQSVPTDLLQRLLDARDGEGDGQGLSDREIRDQLLTLYLAGHDTTAHGVTWALYLLARHPEQQRQVQSELGRVVGQRPITIDDLPALPSLEAAFKEAMRLYPPAVAIPRRATADCQVGPYQVSKGDEAVVWVYAVHHHARYFPEPESFRLDRFTAEQEAARPKHAYLPFGAGQRACVGQTFAMIEAQIILGTLLQRFSLAREDPAPQPMRFGVTLAPKGGLRLRLRGRS